MSETLGGGNFSGFQPGEGEDLLCFSHLRWNFVFQRPQHLMTRAAKERRVFFFEEPIFGDEHKTAHISERLDGNVLVCTPHLPAGSENDNVERIYARLIRETMIKYGITSYFFWYYSAMFLPILRGFEPKLVVYDCMDELSAFLGAPQELVEREQELLRTANLVFTGGVSLYKAKRHFHPHTFAFPSSIDYAHFSQARTDQPDPEDQASIPHPRMGFFGVIDERLDCELIARLAERKPDWHIVLIGPVVKISNEKLPRRDNIHYLGMKSYQELPKYLAGWDIAILPFAHNESTRFISPTKTPEYLAGGRKVISTSITDVVSPYGETKLVEIADGPEEFAAAVERLAQDTNDEARLAKVDDFLKDNSWDNTWECMHTLIINAMTKEERSPLSLEIEQETAATASVAAAVGNGHATVGKRAELTLVAGHTQKVAAMKSSAKS
jgi:UDP-galactopyranose mutase